MRFLRIALLASAATAALSTAALSADLILDPPEEPVMVDNSFTWDGAYFGAFVSGQTVPNEFGLGVLVGANATSDALLYGAELEANWLANNTWSLQVDGRIGVLATESAVLYGFAGIGTHSTNDAFVPVGVGAEFGLSEGLSLKAEYQFNWDLSSSAQDAHVLKAGLNWHF